MRRTPLGSRIRKKHNLTKCWMLVLFLEPLSSDWAAAPVLVRKKDGSMRWCKDYWALNEKTVNGCYSTANYLGLPWYASRNKVFCNPWYGFRLLPNNDRQGWQAQNCFHYIQTLWLVWAYANGNGTMQCPCHFPKGNATCTQRFNMN